VQKGEEQDKNPRLPFDNRQEDAQDQERIKKVTQVSCEMENEKKLVEWVSGVEEEIQIPSQDASGKGSDSLFLPYVADPGPRWAGIGGRAKHTGIAVKVGVRIERLEWISGSSPLKVEVGGDE